jgi:SAM-dependent methyltransferase
MQVYGDDFAGVYDLRWGGFANYVGPKIVDFYNKTSTAARHPRVLDLCCGAGHLSRILLEEGFAVVGLDLSPGMLAHAEKRNRRFIAHGMAEFRLADARDFVVERPFGLVVCTFDAVNHFDDTDELEACFRCVRAALVEEGVFMFDINTERGLRHWNGLEVDDSEEITIISRGVFGVGMSRAYTHVSGFRKRSDGCYTRFEETVYNTVFSVEDVLVRLDAAGFRDVRATHDSDFGKDLLDPEDSSRVFFVARP